MSRIGIICEGSPDGEDERVLKHLAGRICPGASLTILPQGRKPDLIAQCGLVAQALFASGCQRVLIVWDIFPRFSRPDGEAQDIQDIQAELRLVGLDGHPCVYLVAIKAELEAWLLADGAALSSVLSRPAHPVQIGNTKNADHNTNPKKRITNLFERHGRAYTPKEHALQIAQKIPEKFGMLGKLAAFKRFGRSLSEPC